MYLLIGCDDLGFAILREFQKRKVHTIVMDEDTRRLELLRRLGLKESETLPLDLSSPNIFRGIRMESVDVIIVNLADFERTKKVLTAINRMRNEPGPIRLNPVVIVRAEDEAEGPELKKLGASEVLPSNQLLAAATMGTIDRIKLMVSERRLDKILRENWKLGRLAIILQTNPDPDSIASGLALKLYARARNIDADIIYDGVIGHPQNRALVNLLGVELLNASEIEMDLGTRYRWFALVDVATPANCALPPGQTPTIVIDHHTVPLSEVQGLFVEIAPVAATATILTTFLRLSGIEPDPVLSAALFLGLVTDTMTLARQFTPLDMEVFQYLNARMDRTLYAKLTSPALIPEQLELFMRALKSSKVYEDFRFANLGEVDTREAIAVVADSLVGQEGVNTVIAYGVVKNKLYVSARTSLASIHLGNLLRGAFGDEWAGGHANMAGASIPLGRFKPTKPGLKRRIDSFVRRRILAATGVKKIQRKRKRKKK
jgi:nanoRNase/pAp phosphatase (c-di-AMP/oligoRNAs hydrolase)